MKVAAHCHDAHVAVHAKCGRKQPGDALPEQRDVGRRPRHTREEHHDDRHEDENQDAVLTPVDERRERDGEEDARQQVRHNERQERGVLPHLRQVERLVDERGHVDGHDEIERQIEQCLAPDDAHHVLIMHIQRHHRPAVLLSGIAHLHADAQQQCLLDDQHQNGWNEERGKA